MDKRSKEALRRYKKSKQQTQSSSDSSSSDSDSSGSSSYSSSESDCHRKKKARQGARSSSSSADERHKREKREHCQKKLEAKRNHLKRKLKEAKLKKRAAAALSGHSHRALSPATQAKLKKLAERKHQRATSKEHREREKHRAGARERDRDHRISSRSPNKITKIRIHQDVKRQKSPPRMHHQLMSREKIIIQTRTRDRTPSAERERLRHENKMLARERERRERDRERAEREAARDKERAEALARCQERQRERERLAREKLRREEEEKKYGGSLAGERGDHLQSRPSERDIGAVRTYVSRERSLEAAERSRRVNKRDMVDAYEREREFLEIERRGLLDRDDLRRDRDYLSARHRDISPVGEHYAARMRDPRDIYPEERERSYNRPYLDDARHTREHDTWINPRDLRERDPLDLRSSREFRDIDHEIIYPDERERIIRNRERSLAMRGEWKSDWDVPRERGEWEADSGSAPRGFVGGPKHQQSGNSSSVPSSQINPSREHVDSEPDWDADEMAKNKTSSSSNKAEQSDHREGHGFNSGSATPRDNWSDQNDLTQQREKLAPNIRSDHTERRWQSDWREGEETVSRGPLHQHRSERGGRGFRRGGGNFDHLDRNSHSFRSNPPPLMTLPVQPPGATAGYHSASPRFPGKRNMTYTNPNLIKKQQAALAAAKAAAQASAVAAASTAVAAAKAAAQSAANATTNPSILGQSSGTRPQQMAAMNVDGKTEADGVNVSSNQSKTESEATLITIESVAPATSASTDKVSGELSEISDSDDDILNKTDKKGRGESDDSTRNIAKDDSNEQSEQIVPCSDDIENAENRPDDDEMLDFEEISDGELEEDARNKGVGDALGVDWASLIAETMRQADIAAVHSSVGEQPTTAKQKWQPHRVILDVGISMQMAGEEFTKRLLTEAKQKLGQELGEIRLKSKIKHEVTSTMDEDSRTADTDENTSEIADEEKKSNVGSLEEIKLETLNVERLHPIACIQVAQRKEQLERRKLIVNACGANTRALCARQDLKLRRQLCGLPPQECNFPKPFPKVSEKMRAMALAAFQRTLEVK